MGPSNCPPLGLPKGDGRYTHSHVAIHRIMKLYTKLQSHAWNHKPRAETSHGTRSLWIKPQHCTWPHLWSVTSSLRKHYTLIVDYSTPGFPVCHQLPELAQTHVQIVSVAIQPSHPLSSPSPAFNFSQHQSLFKSIRLSHQVAKVLELGLQHQSF